MVDNEIIKYYEDVNFFHKKTEDILFLLQSFVKKFNTVDSEFKFFSSLFIDDKIEKTSCPISELARDNLQEWTTLKEYGSINLNEDTIKIELGLNKVFISKKFCGENEGSYVLAGYIIHSTLEFRIFIAELLEKKNSKKFKEFFGKI